MTARGRLLSGLIATVIALAGLVTVGAPTAAAGPSGTLPYVALGDSYAAGIGAPPYVTSPDGCLQSNRGYPALLDPKGRIDLQANFTCPGATISYVRSKLPSKPDESIRLVTLTVGGNDLGFSALAGACLPPTGTQQRCQMVIDVAESKLTGLRSDLTLLYSQVAVAWPNALIVVTGYPRLVEPTAPFPPFDPVLVAALNAATDELNATIRDAVGDAADLNADLNIVYVDVTDAFAGHGIGALDDPFINSPSVGLPEAFHPNAAGYRAYAKAISAAIRHALDTQKQLA